MLASNTKPFLTTSKTIANIPGLATLIGTQIQYYQSVKNVQQYAAVIAWGNKTSTRKAADVARHINLPLIKLEDGFLRSVGLGSEDAPLSVVVDDLGIYYDATCPSRLENLIAKQLTTDEILRADRLITRWRLARVSKYNQAREYSGELPANYVLVADQTFGDASVIFGNADTADFHSMLKAALTEYPHHKVVVKVHPDVISGKKQGYFNINELLNNPRIVLISQDAHPVKLIEHASAVYCVTSQLGFEALIWGKPVRAFGLPFYAGWGLTHDQQAQPQRRTSVSLPQLVAAALINYPRYLNPETGLQCEVETLLDWMGLQRSMRERFPSAIYAYDFSYYKRPIVKKYFSGSQVFFDRTRPDDGRLYVQAIWGKKLSSQLNPKQTTIRLEDGFIRSVGLGVDLTQPLSWVMDSRGIYYDATQPSDLEQILHKTEFDSALLERAERLIQRIVDTGITKYNLEDGGWLRPKNIPERTRIILVPGQVESDASITFGSPKIKLNSDLLQAVRTANPESYVVYKPHPDVVAGLRHSQLQLAEAESWCDEVVTHGAMSTILKQIDEVHTMTSLTGFEALLRGKKVVCYGQPFYAGWGLTEDINPMPRRQRKLTLLELVVGTLILYPTYISKTTGKFSTPERIIDELNDWRIHSENKSKLWLHIVRYYLRFESIVQALIKP